MRKLFCILLALALVLTSTAALAEGIVLSSNKVEIDGALKEYATAYEAQTGKKVTIDTVGGGADYGGTLKAALQSGAMPDIFVIEGPSGYELWKDYITDLSDQPWASDTDVAYQVDGKVVGFPVAIEGYGLAYNADLLAKAGIDPASLTNINAIKDAFAKLDSQKAELGIDAVVSLAASVTNGMTWVTGLHNFNVYLTGYLPYGDTSVIDQVLAGQLDAARFQAYAEYVKLLFDYSDQAVLLTGNYDSQVHAFATGKTVFFHQGNWTDPNLAAENVSFNIGYAPHAFLPEDTQSIFVSPPSWYVVNSQGANIDEAKAFLTAMATTEEGHKYIVEGAGMVPAFKAVKQQPTGPLSKAVMEHAASGDIYSWQQYKLPDGFGMNTLGPIYELLANGTVDIAGFTALFTDAIATIPTL
ncbi:MAG: ABC transporter substrate-binding protein [Oscillospiraceae bacterium]|nr:ABC transporter substrate-binding protein [Oscillospiraceae bacterium]